MPVPVFVGAGAGVLTTGTSSVVSKTGCTAGNIIMLTTVVGGTNEGMFTTNGSNINKIDGTANAMQALGDGPYSIGSPLTGILHIQWGRAAADGTCSITVNIASLDLVSRLYEFSGASTSTDITAVLKNTDGGPMNQKVGASTTPSEQDPDITTPVDDCLGLAFIASRTNTTVTTLTGMTGGTWAKAVAEYANTPGMISVQTADLPIAGSIGGGSCTLGVSASWCCDAIALVGAPAPGRGAGYLRAYGPAAFATSAADLYTVPAGFRYTIRNLHVNNPSGSEIEFTLSVGNDAAGTRLLDQKAVAAGDHYVSRRAANHTIEAGEKIQGFADSTAAVLVIDGYLYDA